MSSTKRRLVGVGVAIAALAAAAVGSSMQRARAVDAAKLQAQAAADEALGKVATELDTLASGVAKKAEVAARINQVEQMVGQVSTGSDLQQLTNTFSDFKVEAHFAPYRAVGPFAFFLGERLLYASEPTLSEMLMPLAAAATVSGSAHAFTTHGGDVWAVGVGRTQQVNPQQLPILVALGQKLTPALLEPIASTNQLALLLVSGSKPDESVGAGGAAGLAELQRRRTAMKVSSEPCCSRKALVPGVEVMVFKDPKPLLAAAGVEGSQGAPIFFGVGGLLALVGLVFGFRTPRAPDTANAELLKQTADQLRQSQEQLQRLSQQLNVNTDRFAQAAQPPPPAQDDGLGSTQASVQTSRYEIVAPLGEGGMARVSVAVVRGAEGFRRVFVLKRLRPELVNNQEVVNQFIDEARLGASLVHSNIVPVFDFGRDADGYFLAQEYILGRDVDALIEASKERRGRALELPVVLSIGQEALKALGYAHTKRNDAGAPMGLVHRDVSPNNLMLSARGELKLLDFGIVKSADRVTKTQAGVVKGNLFFMSPEQARALEVDKRSDLFSLAMVLVSAATGRPLYSGDNIYDLMNRAGAGPTDADRQRVRDECGPLADVLLKALSLDPAQRYEDAEAFARALAGVGTAASTAEVQVLMETLFADAFAAERQKFSVGA